MYYIWSNVTWFSYWRFLLTPDIFTAYYFMTISYLAACPWNIYMLYLKNQTSGRGSRFISALASLWLWMNYEKVFSSETFTENIPVFRWWRVQFGETCMQTFSLILSAVLSIAFTNPIYFCPRGFIESWILKVLLFIRGNRWLTVLVHVEFFKLVFCITMSLYNFSFLMILLCDWGREISCTLKWKKH